MEFHHVLQPGFRRSENFYRSDRGLQELWKKVFPQEIWMRMEPLVESMGSTAACRMDALAREADRYPPELVPRNWYGEDIQEIRYHPAYWQLMDLAVQSGMFRIKWAPTLRQQFTRYRHAAGFAIGFLYAMAENGLYCPLCMTDGAALLIDKYGNKDDQERLLPRIYTDDPRQFITGAMFLTEKAGGSDVGANRCTARHAEGVWYRLNGEKWFCSNASAQVAFVLARTQENVPGTRGLSLFLVEPEGPDGLPNPRRIVRLKDKLGVRSMASAEIVLTDTWGKRYGHEGEGFKIMADMINLSRLYNALTAVADMRRALAEAWQFMKFRHTFGRPVLDHALVRWKWLHLLRIYYGDLALVWRTIQAYDRSESGDAREALVVRLLTPMAKKCTAENAVYLVRECMELVGGMGYIEDGPLPRLLRDCLVLPIWEGAGNIMALDMARALGKHPELPDILPEVEGLTGSEEVGGACRQIKDRWPKEGPWADLDRLALLQDLESAIKKALVAHYWGGGSIYLKLMQEKHPSAFSSDEVEGLTAWEF